MAKRVKIRKATLNDLGTIYKIERESFAHPYSKKFLSYLLKRKQQINLVAERRDKIVGYSSTRLERNIGHILSVAVHPEWRREGTGTELINYTMKSLKEQKCKEMFLEVRRSNTTAMKFYKKIGFEKKRVKKNYYENGEDAFIYYKSLTDNNGVSKGSTFTD